MSFETFTNEKGETFRYTMSGGALVDNEQKTQEAAQESRDEYQKVSRGLTPQQRGVLLCDFTFHSEPILDLNDYSIDAAASIESQSKIA